MRLRIAVFCVLSMVLLSGATCIAPNPDGSPGPLPAGLAAVAPLLPGPFGGIAAAGASVLTLIGSLFAKRQVNAAIATGTAAAVNPISKALSERKYLLPVIVGGVALGKAFNLWDLDWNALLTALGAAGIAVGADVYESKKEAPKPPTPAT